MGDRRDIMKRLFITVVLSVMFLAAGAFTRADADPVSEKALKGDSELYVGDDIALFCLFFDDHNAVVQAYKGEGVEDGESGEDDSIILAEALTTTPLLVPIDGLATRCKYLSEGIEELVPSETMLGLISSLCAPINPQDLALGCYVTVPASLSVEGFPPIHGYSTAVIDVPVPYVASVAE